MIKKPIFSDGEKEAIREMYNNPDMDLENLDEYSFVSPMYMRRRAEEKKRKEEESVTKFGFIPQRLGITIDPELDNYPYNIMFQSHRYRGDQVMTGTALYFPDLSTFFDFDEESTMIYRNKYGRNSYIVIRHNKSEDSYEAERFVKGESVQLAMGKDWKNIFIHLTMVGLQPGEGCEFS